MFNINNITRQALSSLYPNQDITFFNEKVEWISEEREPIRYREEVRVQGRLQPLSPALVYQLGFNINEHEYYRLYISDITPTQADLVRQLGTTTFIYNNLVYNVVGKLPYDTNGWRELYCYLTDKIKNNYFGYDLYDGEIPENTVGYGLYDDSFPIGEGKFKTYTDI